MKYSRVMHVEINTPIHNAIKCARNNNNPFQLEGVMYNVKDEKEIGFSNQRRVVLEEV